MGTPIDQWQDRLEAQFRALASQRAGSGSHLFALEHGLSAADVKEIGTLLREQLRTNQRLTPHWLLWVVYATEQGYGYAGNEYWQSFEEQTPYWQGSDRYRLAGWFGKFRKTYDAVVPTGPWASHFRIIAWPITHAILPRYLQRQFARALYDLRFRLAGLTYLDPASVGRLFALHAHGSGRLDEFLQQEELTGRIVLALLGVTSDGTTEPISPSTLQRIVHDLEQVRHGREWLKEAQRIVRDRFAGIGQGSGPPTPRATHGQQNERPQHTRLPSIKPAILLRSMGAGQWSALLDIPDFKAIAINVDIRDFLRATRSQLSGAVDLKPAAWLLGASRRAILRSWPAPGKPLIKFERSQPVVDHLLTSDCLMSGGPNWLFRIGSDGIAREITGRIVRPGASYLVAGTSKLPGICPWTTEAELNCAGAQLRRMNVPAYLSHDDLAVLRDADFQVAKTIRVWPAGLPGRAWDGEGSSEWLTTESPCFGIVHDHPIDAYLLRLNDDPEITVEAGVVGHASYVRLPPLPAGKHQLVARAQRNDLSSEASRAPEAEGYLILNVREPEPWRPGQPFHSGLIVTIDPAEPDLDAFWENRVDLSILGPESHHVICRVTLSRGDGTEVLSEQLGDALTLPITRESWRKHLARLTSREDCALKYLEASSGCLIIKGEELGEFRVPFERNVLPIRWVLRKSDEAIAVRLIDDTGQEDHKPRSYFRSMANPLAATELSPDEASASLEICSPGGLLAAQLDAHEDTVVVSVGLHSGGLQGLGVVPTFGELEDGSIDVSQACRVLELWSAARLAGFLPDVRRQQVTDGLMTAIFRRLCGSPWSRAEAVFCNEPNTLAAIDGLQRNVHTRPGFAAVLKRDHLNMNGDFDTASTWYAELANRYRVCTDRSICDAALHLASDPRRFAAEHRDEVEAVLDELQNKPAILRGARMLALLCANGSAPPFCLLPRWAW